MPIEEKPAATSSPSIPTGPMTGRPSGVMARRPDQAAATFTPRRCGAMRTARSAMRRTVSCAFGLLVERTARATCR